MKTREEQIAEMAKVIQGIMYYAPDEEDDRYRYLTHLDKESAKEISEKLIAAGYRKQSDTAREILTWLKLLYSERQKEYTNWDGKKINAITTEWLNSDIETIAAEYGVEVEE